MGTIARSTKINGGEVKGIIPRALIERERECKTPDPEFFGETVIVEDMHTRKRLMAQSSSAFVALPGGYGTVEELFEVITWSQLGIHSLPIIIFNVDGFYDGLTNWINHAVKSGFISSNNRKIIVEATSAAEVIEKIENYIVPDGRLNLNWDSEQPDKK
jgi:uncharacterized protein (TIGR00730 family)